MHRKHCIVICITLFCCKFFVKPFVDVEEFSVVGNRDYSRSNHFQMGENVMRAHLELASKLKGGLIISTNSSKWSKRMGGNFRFEFEKKRSGGEVD